MEDNFPKSIFEILDLDHFRKRPAMFLGEKSISKLRTYMIGYQTCETYNRIKSKETKPPFWLFFPWICKYYSHSGSYYSWDGIILQNCNNDEEKALDTFFQRLDEFRKIRPEKLLFARIGRSEIDFFNSHKGIRWTMTEGKQIRIGPADNIYIVKYNNRLGCSSHHRKGQNGIHSDHFSSLNKAIIDAEREYGKSLQWEEIPKNEIGNIYDKII